MLCVCVCACVRVCACVCACVRVCVCEWTTLLVHDESTRETLLEHVVPHHHRLAAPAHGSRAAAPRDGRGLVRPRLITPSAVLSLLGLPVSFLPSILGPITAADAAADAADAADDDVAVVASPAIPATPACASPAAASSSFSSSSFSSAHPRGRGSITVAVVRSNSRSRVPASRYHTFFDVSVVVLVSPLVPRQHLRVRCRVLHVLFLVFSFLVFFFGENRL